MPSLLVRTTALVLLVAAAVVAGEAMAQKGGPPDKVSRESPQVRHSRGDDQRALSDAVRRVERRTGGRVLSAERVPFDGRDVSRVKVVDQQGRVRVFMDDPSSTRQPRQLPSRPDPRRTRDDDD
ncbi:PepSY domain-containing protein [Marilutibacter alkalisoli]|uniref:PepSY domain-containing protein n=1 Tax=Marilutibacter alkalisoli TaxID=2591633 RepID=UPI001FC9AA55|nr:hypothetical protein [Lysobacter alkalisoli]